jgi:hypothetical protein
MATRRYHFSGENLVLGVVGLVLAAACVYVCLWAQAWHVNQAALAPIHVSAAPPPLPAPPLDVAVNNRGPNDASLHSAPAALVDQAPAPQQLPTTPTNGRPPNAPEPKAPAVAPPPSVSIGPAPMPPPRPADLGLQYDQFTAVYDLKAHTVYLPGGARLEAHSGLGDRLDDPRHVDEQDRGATPPHLYDLSLREQPFHGVQALRLNPVGGASEIFGRAGLLAHTYMLGPNGDSNGCVSFKDYDAFLRAFQNGEVKRLAVVASRN